MCFKVPNLRLKTCFEFSFQFLKDKIPTVPYRVPAAVESQGKTYSFQLGQVKSVKVRKFEIIFNCGQGKSGSFFVTSANFKIHSILFLYQYLVLSLASKNIADLIGQCIVNIFHISNLGRKILKIYNCFVTQAWGM